MSPRYDKEWIAGLLDSDKRLGPLSPEEFLRQSGLMDGMSVVDYGCGPGLFTMAAANVVGAQGLVYALDIELDLDSGAEKKELLEALQGHVLARGQLMGTYQWQ